MIIDVERFILEERRFWTKLETILDKLENEPEHRMGLEQVNDFHYLYQRTLADLGKIMSFTSEPATRQYLESLVRRAYGEIHEGREKQHRLAPLYWFFHIFPRTFRRHIQVFWLVSAITLTGCAFGGFAVSLHPEDKEIIIPFCHLRGHPSERVTEEEEAVEDRLMGAKTTFSAYLMTHNVKVCIFNLAMGMTWGIGTVILLFYNGVILGAITVDYCLAGEIKFLLGWLLPHGVIEIPAFLLAGQTGLVLASALIGWGSPISLKMRLREVSGDLITLIFGVAIMLVWAGLVEAFLSQYHEPIVPYFLKVGFGIVELILLILFFAKSGAITEKKQGLLYEQF